MRRYVLVLLVTAGVTIIGFGVLASRTRAGSQESLPAASRLSLSNQTVLNNVLLNGRTRVLPAPEPSGSVSVTVLLATESGMAGHVAQEVLAIGGVVEARDDKVDYLRATVALDRWEPLVSRSEILAFQLDGNKDFRDDHYGRAADHYPMAVPMMASNSETRPPSEKPRLDSSLANRAPYSTDEEMGVTALRRRHPTFDGRGVTIAVVESAATSIWVSHPSLSRALTLQGEPSRKVRALLTPTVPDDYPVAADVYLEVEQLREIDAQGTLCLVGGRTYVLPAAGRFQLGTLRLQRTGRFYAVLWDERADRVWIDVNQNNRFDDDLGLPDFNDTEASDGIEGLIRDGQRSIPFTVTTDTDPRRVRVWLGIASHTLMTGTIAAGLAGAAGFVSGVAPAASLVFVDSGAMAHTALEGLMQAASRADVDVISMSTGISSSTMDEGQLIPIVLDRIVTAYGKPIFVAMGNNYGAAASGGTQASGIAAVGAFASQASLAVMRDIRVAGPDWILPYSSRGPAMDGDSKPDFVAAGMRVAGRQCDIYRAFGAVLRDFVLPPCYEVGNGTSAATPAAAGVAALLISGAKQRGISYDPERLVLAMQSGARFLPGWGVEAQGRGLVQADRAWDLLQAARVGERIRFEAPLEHVMSPYVRASAGRGLYEREGWRSGQLERREVTVIRERGPAEPIRYDVNWVGNDGTFEAPSTVVLPLSTPIKLPVRIRPVASGVHSTLLELRQPKTGLVVAQTMLTVVAGEPLERTNGYSHATRGRLGPLERHDEMIRVPSGADAVRVTLTIRDGAAKYVWFRPSAELYQPPADVMPELFWRARPEGTYAMSTPAADAGTWNLTVMSDERSATGNERVASFDLQVKAQRAGLQAEPVPGGNTMLVRAENLMAPLARAQTRLWAGVARRVPFTASERATLAVEQMDVPPDAPGLLIGTCMADAGETATTFLYDCTAGACFLHTQTQAATRDSRLLLRRPRPGIWKVIVAPGPRTRMGARGDLALFLASGLPSTSDTGRPRATGERWREEIVIPAASTVDRVGYEPGLMVEVVDVGAEEIERQQPFGKLDQLVNRPLGLGVQLLFSPVFRQSERTAAARGAVRSR